MGLNVKLLLVLAIQSPGTGSLSGEVLDPSGAVIQRASLTLRRPASGQEWRQSADATGHYSFEGLEAGRYYLTAGASGFSTALKEVTLGAGHVLIEDFSLSVAALSEQLSVMASRTEMATGDTPVAMSVVDSLEIERSGVTTIGDLFRNEPLSFITPLKAVLGLRWQDDRNRFWNEYGTRIVTRQERLSDAFMATNAGPEPGYVVHDWRAGVNIPQEAYRLGITVGVLNLGNRLYNEQFESAPARGRTVTLGLNMDF